MPASGRPIVGKGGSISLANATGATPTFTLAAEVKDYKLSEEAEEVKGDRLTGPDFIETDTPLWRGEFVLYAAKSDAGVAMPFKTGDRISMNAVFGGNTAIGHVRILGRGEITVVKNEFVRVPVKWAQDDDAFAVTLKVISIA